MMTCRPHQWADPLPLDDRLYCVACGRELAIDTCEPYRLNAIAKAHGPDFARALHRAVRVGREHDKVVNYQ